MSKTIAQIIAEAEEIRVETDPNGNTAERVGTAIKDVAEYVNNNNAKLNTTTKKAETALNLAEELSEEGRYIIEGNVTNNPDEVTLTSSDDKLQLKNRPYLASVGGVQGQMGYVILAKGQTFKQQVVAISEGNTIFEIRYDYDLGGEEVRIPENCVLKFEGGSISNGTVVVNNSTIKSDTSNTLFKNVKIIGSIANEYLNINWMGVPALKISTLYEEDQIEKVDAGSIIKNYLNEFIGEIHFDDGDYFFSPLHVNWDNFRISGNSDRFKFNTNFYPIEDGQSYIIKVGGVYNNFNTTTTHVKHTYIKGITFSCAKNVGNGFGIRPKHMIDLPDANNEPGYHGGLLCLDQCNAGNIDIQGVSVYDIPLISIGYSYEIKYDYIVCYGNRTKSDCPVINFAGKDGTIVSSSYINAIQCESICGPVIGVANKAQITELRINYFNYEQTIWWVNGAGYVECLTENREYFRKNPVAKIAELNALDDNEEPVLYKVPIIDVYSGTINIGSMMCSNIFSKWINYKDKDIESVVYSDYQECCSSFFRARQSAGLHINDLEYKSSPYVFLSNLNESTFKNSRLEIDNVTGTYEPTDITTLDLYFKLNSAATNTNYITYLKKPYLVYDVKGYGMQVSFLNPNVPFLGVDLQLNVGDRFDANNIEAVLPRFFGTNMNNCWSMYKDTDGSNCVIINNNDRVLNTFGYPLRVSEPVYLQMLCRIGTTSTAAHSMAVDYCTADGTVVYTDGFTPFFSGSNSGMGECLIPIVPHVDAPYAFVRRNAGWGHSLIVKEINVIKLDFGRLEDKDKLTPYVTSHKLGYYGGLKSGYNKYEYHPTDFDCTIYYNGSKWVNDEGIDMTDVTSIKGATATRTAMTLSSVNAGLKYYDTDLKKYVLWNGTAWTNLDGTALS